MDLPRTLVFSPRANETSQVLAPAAHRRGLLTEHLTGWRVPEGFTIGGPAHLYAGPLFADAVAADLGVACLEPPDDWLTLLPSSATRRRIRLTTMAEAWQLRVPTFVKPPNDKSFPARVYREGGHLPGPDAVDADTPVLLSDPVRFTAEFRLHVLDGRIVAASQYAIDGDLAVAPAADHPAAPTVLSFGAALARDWAESLPSAVVIDVGLLDDSGRLHPAAIEANAAWAAGHYAAEPDPVLETVLRAAGPIAELADSDRRFRRAPATIEL
jgi:hypothetical protein